MPLPKAIRRVTRKAAPAIVKTSALLPVATVIHHVGRKSGKPYATPVQSFATDTGAVVMLPYGTDLDWIRNLQAAGGGTLVRGKTSRAVSAPVVVPKAEVLPHVSSAVIRQGMRAFPVKSGALFTWA